MLPIDIESWLSRFNNKRKFIKELATFLYPNKKSSDIQRRVFLSIVDYLCVPASKNILRYILYYVFYLLDKKVDIYNHSEEVCSEVIKLITYVDWQEEYKLAKESLTFNECNDEFKNEPIGKIKMLNFAKTLYRIGIELENENERFKKERKMGFNLSHFGLYLTFQFRSEEKIKLEYISGKYQKDNKGKVKYLKIKGQSPQSLSIYWETDASGQHLIFKHNSIIVATFSQLNNGELQWKPLSEFNKLSRRIAIRFWPHYDPYNPIVSTSLEQFFLKWLMNEEFTRNLILRSRKLEYLPALVKLLLLYMSYTAERTEKFTETGLLGSDMQLSLDEVVKTYKSLISGLVGDTPRMKRIYEVD